MQAVPAGPTGDSCAVPALLVLAHNGPLPALLIKNRQKTDDFELSWCHPFKIKIYKVTIF
jgi:hypothetical protein